MKEYKHVNDFLLCATPDEWVEQATRPENLPTLLVDHANLERKAAQSALTMLSRYAHGIPGIAAGSRNVSVSEKKAASTALSVLYRDVERAELLQKLSRLAREELRHFEQVLAIMQARGIDYVLLSPSRYAGALHKLVRSQEPHRLLDTLLIGAFIEARSYERFKALAPQLDSELQKFYGSLLQSEERHFQEYLQLAARYFDEDFSARIALIAEREAELISSGDAEFRFHSGMPLSQ